MVLQRTGGRLHMRMRVRVLDQRAMADVAILSSLVLLAATVPRPATFRYRLCIVMMLLHVSAQPHTHTSQSLSRVGALWLHLHPRSKGDGALEASPGRASLGLQLFAIGCLWSESTTAMMAGLHSGAGGHTRIELG